MRDDQLIKWKRICLKSKKPVKIEPVTAADLALWAGYMLGLSFRDKKKARPFDEWERTMFKRMSVYLREKAGLK